MAGELHTYQCGGCKSTATSTFRFTAASGLLECPACKVMFRRYMKYLFSEAISVEEYAIRSKEGPRFNEYVHKVVNTTRPCDECHKRVEKDAMIRLGAGGNYCSAACADIGTEKHRVVMEGQLARLEALYEQQPWLRPQVKETA